LLSARPSSRSRLTIRCPHPRSHSCLTI